MILEGSFDVTIKVGVEGGDDGKMGFFGVMVGATDTTGGFGKMRGAIRAENKTLELDVFGYRLRFLKKRLTYSYHLSFHDHKCSSPLLA